MAVKASYKVTLVRVNDGAKGDTGAQGPKGDTGAKGADGQMLLATCSTDGATAAKVATLASGSISLKTGTGVAVKFTSANSSDTPTLNVAGTGAKEIRAYASTVLTADYYWSDGATVDFVYDGIYWLMMNPDAVSKAKEYARAVDDAAKGYAENAQAAAESNAKAYSDQTAKDSKEYTDNAVSTARSDLGKDISSVRTVAQQAADSDATTRQMLTDYQATVGQWLTFDPNTGLIVGAQGSDYATQITDNRVALNYQGQAAAYVSGKQFYTPELVVTSRLIIGNYMLVVNPNGSISIMKKGT